MSGLSGAQIEQYHRDGYVVVRGVLAQGDLEGVRTAVSRHIDSEARRLFAEGKIGELFEDLPFDRRLIEVYRPLSKKSTNWNAEVFSSELHAFGRHPAILDVVEPLVGPEIQFNGDYWVRTKFPEDFRTTFPWHQDSGYYGDPTEFPLPTLWIPLVDVDEENGCLQVIPGSHHWGLLPTVTNGLGQHEPAEDVETRGKPMTLPMKTGEILIFQNLTFHRSLMNNARTMRWSIDLRYSAAGRPLAWLDKLGLTGYVARSRATPAVEDDWKSWQRRRAAGIAAGRGR